MKHCILCGMEKLLSAHFLFLQRDSSKEGSSYSQSVQQTNSSKKAFHSSFYFNIFDC